MRDFKAFLQPLLGVFAVILATAAWGTSGVFVKFVGQSLPITALALAFWRDTFSFLILFLGLCIFKPEWLRINGQHLRWLVGLGVSLGSFHVVWNLAVMVNGAAVATVQQAAMPAIVAVAAWFLWREPLTWIKGFAIALTFAGTVLISGLDVLGEAELSWGGLLIGMGVPLLYAAWSLFGKKVRESYNPLTLLTYGFGFGALVLLPLQVFTPQPWPIPPVSWLWFAGLVLIATLTGFSLYTFALGRLPASVASILAMVEIPFVTVYAYVLLDERLNCSQVIGAILVVVGVLLLFHRKRAARP